MKNIFQPICLLLLTGLLIVTTNTLLAQERYRNYDPRFSIDLPLNWVKEKPKGPNTKLLLVEKKSGSTIIVLVLPQIDSRFRSAHDLTLNELSKGLNVNNEEKVLSFKKIYINQQPATCLTTQYRWRSMDIDTMMKSTTYTIIVNNLAYHISVGSDFSNFDKMQPIFDKIVGSFVIEDGFFNSIDISTVDSFTSKADNFSVSISNPPNIDKKDNLTTYVFTSIADTAIYRINVLSNVVFFTNPQSQSEFVQKYYDESTSELKAKDISYSYLLFQNKLSIEFYGELLTYGEIPMLGEKAKWKSITIINKDKIYTLQVTSTDSSIESNYKYFVSQFKFLY